MWRAWRSVRLRARCSSKLEASEALNTTNANPRQNTLNPMLVRLCPRAGGLGQDPWHWVGLTHTACGGSASGSLECYRRVSTTLLDG